MIRRVKALWLSMEGFSRKRGSSRCCRLALPYTGRTDLVAETPYVRRDRSPPAGGCPFRGARSTCLPHEPPPRFCTEEPLQLPDRVQLAGIHALDLGVILEHRNAAAPHREAVQPRHKEAHVRLEQLDNRQPVPLMALIYGPEHVVQFPDQVIHFGRCLDRSFDRDAHGASAKVQRPA